MSLRETSRISHNIRIKKIINILHTENLTPSHFTYFLQTDTTRSSKGGEGSEGTASSSSQWKRGTWTSGMDAQYVFKYDI